MHKTIESYYTKLVMYAAFNPNGDKEQEMIDLVESQLALAEQNRPLGLGELARAHYKISRVSCFSERYSKMVDYLDAYHEAYMALREMNSF